jgi:hypothetical protein
MPQIIDPIPTNVTVKPITCCYVNCTSKIQVARITNIPNWYFERVVFPGQRLVFEAMPESQLEIHTGMMASAILSDRIPCEELRLVAEDSPASSEPSPSPTLAPTPRAVLDNPGANSLNSLESAQLVTV